MIPLSYSASAPEASRARKSAQASHNARKSGIAGSVEVSV